MRASSNPFGQGQARQCAVPLLCVVSVMEVIKAMSTEDWIRNVKANPPPEGELVEVMGSDALGEWAAMYVPSARLTCYIGANYGWY